MPDNHLSTFIAIAYFRLGLETILLDLTHVNVSYEKLDLPAIDGVLGSDLMMEYKAVIDYQKKELTLRWKKRSYKL